MLKFFDLRMKKQLNLHDFFTAKNATILQPVSSEEMQEFPLRRGAIPEDPYTRSGNLIKLVNDQNSNYKLKKKISPNFIMKLYKWCLQSKIQLQK